MSTYTKLIIRDAITRFAELMISSIIISVVLYIAFMMKWFPHTLRHCFYYSALAAVIFVGVNVFMLRSYYKTLEYKKSYFLVAYSAYFVFAFLGAFIYKYISHAVFTAMFALTKFMKYSKFAIATPYAVGAFHAAMCILMIFIPIGATNEGHIIKAEEKEREWRKEGLKTRQTRGMDGRGLCPRRYGSGMDTR